MPLGEQIRRPRAERRWSQADLASHLGTNDAAAISRYENGKMTPTTDVVVRLAEIFDVTTDYLLIDGAPHPAALSATLATSSPTRSPSPAASPQPTRPPSPTSSTGLLANHRIRAALDQAR